MHTLARPDLRPNVPTPLWACHLHPFGNVAASRRFVSGIRVRVTFPQRLAEHQSADPIQVSVWWNEPFAEGRSAARRIYISRTPARRR